MDVGAAGARVGGWWRWAFSVTGSDPRSRPRSPGAPGLAALLSQVLPADVRPGSLAPRGLADPPRPPSPGLCLPSPRPFVSAVWRSPLTVPGLPSRGAQPSSDPLQFLCSGLTFSKRITSSRRQGAPYPMFPPNHPVIRLNAKVVTVVVKREDQTHWENEDRRIKQGHDAFWAIYSADRCAALTPPWFFSALRVPRKCIAVRFARGGASHPGTEMRRRRANARIPEVRGPLPKLYCCGCLTLGGSLNISVKPRGSTRVGDQTAAETGTQTWAGRLTFGVCSWPAACVFPIKSSVSWSPRLWAEPDELQGTGLLGLHHNVCVLMPGVWWAGTKCCVYLFFFNFYFLLRYTW